MRLRLGGEWWLGLDATEQTAITHVYAATCNAHRWVNVGKGFEEGIKAARAEAQAAQQVTRSRAPRHVVRRTQSYSRGNLYGLPSICGCELRA